MKNNYSVKTKLIWKLENLIDLISNKLQCLRVNSQLKDISKNGI